MNSLEQLYAELDRQLQRRLAEIEQQCQERLAALERDQGERRRTRLDQLRRTHQAQLRQLRRKADREAQARQQQRLWQCQQRCLGELLAEARAQLARQAPEPGYLASWLREARARLPATSQPHLKVASGWLALLEPQHLPGTAAAILGGAILTDPETGIEVDGSWERRLETLTPELWQRWLSDVGADDPD